jgi:alpha-tubulin suppressor-like RCC1 family protein
MRTEAAGSRAWRVGRGVGRLASAAALAIPLLGLWCCSSAYAPGNTEESLEGGRDRRLPDEDVSTVDPPLEDSGRDVDADADAGPVRMQIALGAAHACVLRESGKVACWGLNSHGELGDATNTGHPRPADVTGISSAIAIAAGMFHSCAILRGGKVECWGDNFYQQLGRPASPGTTSNVPVPVTGLTGPAVSISANDTETCVILASGAVQCWGSNGSGQLGDTTTEKRTSAVSVSGITAGATAVRPGSNHACAIVGTGIRCWGYNDHGGLGDNTHNTTATPVSVVGLLAFPDTSPLALAAGEGHTCAIVTGGQVRCWGYGLTGELGNGVRASSNAPVTVAGVQDARAIGSSYSHTCALLASGGVRCWGNNQFGQLAIPGGIDQPTPVTVAGLGTPATDIACGGGNFAIGGTGYRTGQSCAIVNKAVLCWGDNQFGQLGTGGYLASVTPVMVQGL